MRPQPRHTRARGENPNGIRAPAARFGLENQLTGMGGTVHKTGQTNAGHALQQVCGGQSSRLHAGVAHHQTGAHVHHGVTQFGHTGYTRAGTLTLARSKSIDPAPVTAEGRNARAHAKQNDILPEGRRRRRQHESGVQALIPAFDKNKGKATGRLATAPRDRLACLPA